MFQLSAFGIIEYVRFTLEIYKSKQKLNQIILIRISGHPYKFLSFRDSNRIIVELTEYITFLSIWTQISISFH